MGWESWGVGGDWIGYLHPTQSLDTHKMTSSVGEGEGESTHRGTTRCTHHKLSFKLLLRREVLTAENFG